MKGGVSTFTKKYDKSKSIITQDDILELTGKYACAVVAMTEICLQESVISEAQIASAYNDLWYMTDTKVDKSVTDGGVTHIFGSTPFEKLETGLWNYLSMKGRYSSKYYSKIGPDFSYFLDAMENDYSAMFTYNIYEKKQESTDLENIGIDEGADYEVIGHAVNVVGCYTVTISGAAQDYLIVVTGWNDNDVRYINYGGTSFTYTRASVFEVSNIWE